MAAHERDPLFIAIGLLAPASVVAQVLAPLGAHSAIFVELTVGQKVVDESGDR